MDAGSISRKTPRRPAWRPKGCQAIALVLQGGGALGAYQAGVYQALHESGLEPDWIVGVSIGGINSALIAGNAMEQRLDRLIEFWEMVTGHDLLPPFPEGDASRRLRNVLFATQAMLFGQPGFFAPHRVNPWFSPRGAHAATSFYDTKPLRETLRKLVNFELINDGSMRFAVGAVNLATANFLYFDNTRTTIKAEHVMASGALPPALPMVRIGGHFYWDGGLVSNTPLQHVLENCGPRNMLVFQVDLFAARGEVPRDMFDVMSRQKDIQYSSRTRLTTDRFVETHALKLALRRALARVPEEQLSVHERRLKQELADLPQFNILHLIYQQKAYEGEARDYEFSRLSMREHWRAGYEDTMRTLAHEDWLAIPDEHAGITVHDLHRDEE